MLELKLARPIIFFDLETTGVSRSESRIVQIALIKFLPHGKVVEKCRLINPNMPIPYNATKVHGITDEMVKDQPYFQHISKSLFNIFDGCDVAGFNSRNFDLPILRNEFKRAGIEYNYLDYNDIDVFLFEKHLRRKFNKPYKLNEKISLTALHELYHNKSLEGAHDALVDVRGTINVFNAQLKELRKTTEDIYNEIPNNGNYKTHHNPKILLHDDNKYYWNFGKHIGKPITIDINYARWFVGIDNFPIEERKIVKEENNLLYD